MDIYPVPRQSVHLSLMILPLPWQSGQVCTLRTVPKRDCWVKTTWPLPPHLGQVSGLVPGFAPEPLQVLQVSFTFSSISFLQPNTASSKVMRTLVRRFAPFMGPLLRPLLRPPPKRSPKISPKISPKSAPLKSNPPPPPIPPSKAAWPN